MTAERLGDRAILVRGTSAPGLALDAVHRLWPDLTDVVEAFGALGLYFAGEPPSPSAVLDALESLGSRTRSEPRRHSVPVCYALGPDFDSIGSQLGLRRDELIAAHASPEYVVEAIGFSPGFPYLSGLPEALHGLPRLESPRQRVAPGSVGIVEDLCCIYPDGTPGGWNLIGRTPVRIVNLQSDYFRFSVGDLVRFEPIPESEFESRGRD